ncbi:uncharacterized protein AMSG_09098 [Thecamonas trahens ATCC 50062]|uniref:ODAD1 central coiled coil region domain-containing protein n=1 Tax=Thecamonas trahens ATCC 50062 TaxID=461836 RepID=A0A0L0DL03_THETB|nr:hypothetical protein AMSG_09098 [Thecamonas trahens ATCC 50062]KNC52930.1 hypothetical protein AMSG_09098 [Thecamonas trahens ATCC 50062]|eukprot:XP_013754825.1 hypothetical protein AMSG_09098 [Thecamonas trahens ATCC 50062]
MSRVTADLQVLRLEDALSKMRRKYDLAVAGRRESEEKVEEFRGMLAKVRSEAKNRLDKGKDHSALKEVAEKRETALKNLKNKVGHLEAQAMTALAANEARDADIRLLMEQYATEKQSWVAEVAMLREYIEKDQKMREHIYNRNMRVAEQVDGAGPGGPRAAGAQSGVGKGTVKEQLELHKWKQGVKDVSHMNTIDRALERIKTIMCVDDLDEAVAKFVAAEETQDHFLNAINELHARKSEIEQTNEALREQLNTIQTADYLGKSDHKRTKVLETKLYQAEVVREKLLHDHMALKKLFNQVMQGISELCAKSGAIGKGDEYLYKQGIAESNVMTYLGLVEERLLDLIHHPAVARAQQQAVIQAQGGYSNSLMGSMVMGNTLSPRLGSPSRLSSRHSFDAQYEALMTTSPRGIDSTVLDDSLQLIDSDDSLNEFNSSRRDFAISRSDLGGRAASASAVVPLTRRELKRSAEQQLRSAARKMPSSSRGTAASASNIASGRATLAASSADAPIRGKLTPTPNQPFHKSYSMGAELPPINETKQQSVSRLLS